MADEQIITLIKEYLVKLKEEGIMVTKAILFGSYAFGNAHADSDIDLLIVSPQFDNGEDKYIGKLWKATKCSNYRIEPIAIGVTKFDVAENSPIISLAKKHGFEIAA